MGRLLALVIVVLGVHGMAAQSSDWSGAWISHGGDDVHVVRHIQASARGWSGVAEGIVTSRAYRIVIVQTAAGVTIDFPGGAKNILTFSETPLDGATAARVVNAGEWWTKYVLTARVTGDVLALGSTSFSGWWRDGGPEQARPAPTDFKKRVTLSRGAASDLLAVRVELSDEKGELEYVQAFRRQP